MVVVSDTTALPAREGDLLAGRFEVGRPVAVGSRSTVFVGKDCSLDQSVAIKVIHANLASSTLAARFMREARNAARVETDHAPRFVDVGQLPNGQPFLVMEFLHGQTLRNSTSHKPEVPVQEAVDYIVQAGDAVAAAHSVGILHRDLRPSNLYRTVGTVASPHIKVLGFGTARAFDPGSGHDDDATSRAYRGAGAHAYYAPEQFGAAPLDGRCDVWALGAVLYALLTLRSPFSSFAPAQTMRKILDSDPEPPRNVRSIIPAELEEIVLSCLRKAPDARPASVAALVSLLAPFASQRGAAVASSMAERWKDAADVVAYDEAAPDLPLASASIVRLRHVPMAGATRPRPRSKYTLGASALTALLACGSVALLHARPTAPRPPLTNSSTVVAPVAQLAVASAQGLAWATPPASVLGASDSILRPTAPAPPAQRPSRPRDLRQVPPSTQPSSPPRAPTADPDPWGWQK